MCVPELFRSRPFLRPRRPVLSLRGPPAARGNPLPQKMTDSHVGLRPPRNDIRRGGYQPPADLAPCPRAGQAPPLRRYRSSLTVGAGPPAAPRRFPPTARRSSRPPCLKGAVAGREAARDWGIQESLFSVSPRPRCARPPPFRQGGQARAEPLFLSLRGPDLSRAAALRAARQVVFFIFRDIPEIAIQDLA